MFIFPQGGVVSADFWKIAFNPAIEIINSSNTTGFGYADDLIVLRHGYKTDTSIKALQTVLNRLVTWGETCNLKFNPSKTQMILFSNQRSPPKIEYPLSINNNPVSQVTSLRYLGVTVDSKLEWDIHRNRIIQSAKQHLITISQKIAKLWGPKPHISKWIYTGIIRPKILYGAMNWGHTLKTQKVIDQFEKLDRIALHMITPTRKSISTASLQVIHDLLPLVLMIQKSGLSAHRRLNQVIPLNWSGVNKSKSQVPHLRHWEDLKLEYNLHYPDTDKIREFNWGRKYQIKTDSFGPSYKDYLIHSQFTVPYTQMVVRLKQVQALVW